MSLSTSDYFYCLLIDAWDRTTEEGWFTMMNTRFDRQMFNERCCPFINVFGVSGNMFHTKPSELR